jgi:cytidylate kinase
MTIYPNADVKLFITARLHARARRRYRELLSDGTKTSFQAVHRDRRRRDDQDASRNVSPLRPAADAIVLDTTDLSVEEAFTRALGIFKEKTENIDQTPRVSGCRGGLG